MPATQVKRRRGTTAQNNAFTGAEGEITVDTQLHQLRVHDGSTQGGFLIGRESQAALSAAQQAQNTANTANSTANSALSQVNSKVNLNGSNLTGGTGGGKVRCVVETYISGTSWYRKYSDGWVEQGGYVSAAAASATISLLVRMSSSSYSILFTVATGAGTQVHYAPGLIPNTASQASFQLAGIGIQNTNGWWYVCGYAA